MVYTFPSVCWTVVTDYHIEHLTACLGYNCPIGTEYSFSIFFASLPFCLYFLLKGGLQSQYPILLSRPWTIAIAYGTCVLFATVMLSTVGIVISLGCRCATLMLSIVGPVKSLWIKCATVQLQICSSPVLKCWDGGPESYSSVHAKKPSIYGDDFLSHGMSVLSQYFHLVSTKCKMKKI